MIKKVVISGYYGFDNLGDEAVLQSIIQALRNEEPDLEITVLSKDPQSTANRYGVNARDRWRILQIVKTLQNADLLVSGGGSLLQDVTSQLTIPYYLGVVGLAKILGKKVAFYAQGIGPIEGFWGRLLTRILANWVQLITVRDQESLALLESIGVRKPPMEVTVDPVVLLEPRAPETQEYRELLKLRNRCTERGIPLIGIAPRPWQGLTGFKEALIQTIERLQKEREAEILLIPMHREVDLPFCQEIGSNLSKVKVIEGEYQPDQMLTFYQQLSLLIGIRLHALIFSAVAHVPIVGISYDPKIDSFLKRISDQAIANIESLQSESLYIEIIRRLDDLANYREQIITQVGMLQEQARKNARMVLNLL